jgi:DNA-directed RNA polymerase specialized sigma24 family protein
VSNENNQPAPDAVSRRKGVERAIVEYGPYTRRLCFRLLDDREDGKDMAQDILITAWKVWSGQGLPKNPEAWLNVVSRNRAIDYWKKRQRAPKLSDEDLDLLEIPGVDSSSPRLAVDGNQFLERVRCMLDKNTAEHFDLYLGKLFYDWEDSQIALKLGLSPAAGRAKIRRVEEAVAKRVEVLRLIDPPGTGTNRCSVPQEEFVRLGSRESPALYTAVRKHLRDCNLCDDRRKESGLLADGVLPVLPLLAPPQSLLERLAKLTVPAKSVAAACVAAASLTLFFMLKPIPEAPPLPPVAHDLPRPEAEPKSTAPSSTAAAPSTSTQLAGQASGAPSSETSTRTSGATTEPAVPSPGEPVPPPGETSAPSTPGERGDRGPAVVGAQIDRRRVVVAETHPCCGEHEYAEVEVVDAEAASVEIGFSGHDRSFSRALKGDPRGRVFKGHLGPFTDASFRGRYTLVIRVVARDGSMTSTPFDSFEVVSCRRSG